MTLDEIEKRFIEISKMEELVEQSEQIEDICYDGEILLEEGKKDLAIEIFKKILEIDLIEDDLSQNALWTAEAKLIELGVIKLKPLELLEKEFSEQFNYQNEAMKLLSISKSIWADWRRKNAETAKFCLNLISLSEKISPLSRKDKVFKFELENWK